MELTLKTSALYTAILLTGLSAGLFCSWQVSVIPGTRRASDPVFIEVMQKINRAIINPLFMVIFMGPIILQILSLILYRNTELPFWILMAAALAYGAGTIIVTGAGNVPLNNELDAVKAEELSKEKLSGIRQDYETPWNRLHLIRTVFSVLSFMLLLLTAFILS